MQETRTEKKDMMHLIASAVVRWRFVIMLLCTLFSVNRFLRMTAGELYKS